MLISRLDCEMWPNRSYNAQIFTYAPTTVVVIVVDGFLVKKFWFSPPALTQSWLIWALGTVGTDLSSLGQGRRGYQLTGRA